MGQPESQKQVRRSHGVHRLLICGLILQRHEVHVLLPHEANENKKAV